MSEEPKEPQTTKEEAFAEDPERFIDGHTIVLAISRGPQGMMIALHPISRAELIRAKGEIDAAVTKELLLMDLKADAERKGVITPAHGILDAARRGLFKKK